MQKHKILLDSEWTLDSEADDIIKYYTIDTHRAEIYELLILSTDEMNKMDNVIFFDGTVFGKSETIQQHLRDYKPEVANQIIPDTYDHAFRDLYHRDIEIITLCQLNNKYLSKGISRFIKPLGNTKSFDGKVIDSNAGLAEGNCDYFDDLAVLFANNPTLNGNTEIYASPVIDIQGEIRLLVGQGRLYGRGQISIAEPPNHDYLVACSNKTTNAVFMDKLIAATGDRFLCVDIGWVPELGTWVIVEINPPFALDDYDIPLTNYLSFTEDAFKWIREKLIHL